MNPCSNIEFINYDGSDNENQTMSNDNDLNMEYLNNFILDKFNSNINQNYNSFSYGLEGLNNSFGNFEVQNHHFQQLTLNSGLNSDNDSCFSENFSMNCFSDCRSLNEFNLNLNELNNSQEDFSKSSKLNFDKLKEESPISGKTDTSPNASLFASRLFRCSELNCDKVYKSKENLTLHIKNIHLKEKPYNCKYCPALFSHRNGKTYHERKFHTKYLPHKCPFESKILYLIFLDCSVAFASKSALSYHLKSQHINKRGIKKIEKSKFENSVYEN